MATGVERSARSSGRRVGAPPTGAAAGGTAARVAGRASLTLLCLLALAACAREQPDARPSWAPLAITSTEPASTLRLDLREADEQARWQLRRSVARDGEDPNGLALRITGADPHLSRALERPTASLERVTVRTVDPVAEGFVVYLRIRGTESEAWAVPMHATDADRRVHAATVGAVSWPDGPVEAVRLDPPEEAVGLVISEVVLESASDVLPHRIGDEVRPCLVADAVRSRDPVALGSHLALGLGVPARRPGQPLEIRVTAADSGQLLASRRVDASAGPRWASIDVELRSGEPATRDEPEPVVLSLVVQETQAPVSACFAPPIVGEARHADAGVHRRPNVLLVSLDTLRADALEHAPYLRSLAARGRSFDRVWASASWTLPSHASLFTSTPVLEHDTPHVAERRPFAGSRLPSDLPLLAEQLARAGYRTAASTGGGYVAPEYGFWRGFERYRAATDRAGDAAARHLELVDGFLADAAPGPFFLFVHTYAVHDYFMNDAPYHDFVDPDEDAALVNAGSYLDAIVSGEASPAYARRLYAAGVRRADAFVEALVRSTLARSDDQPLLVLVTSDHGESFGEPEGVWHHGTSLEDEQLRVPLIVWGSFAGAPGGGRQLAATSTLDIAPSLLAWLGVPVPETFRGERDRLDASPATTRHLPVLAGTPHTTRPHGERRLDQAIVAPPLEYIRTDAPDGRTRSEACLAVRDTPGEGERVVLDVARCAALRRQRADMYDRMGRGVLVVRRSAAGDASAEAVELTFPPGAARWSAVHASTPSPGPLGAVGDGPIRWTPIGEEALLFVHLDRAPDRVVEARSGTTLVLRPDESDAASLTDAGAGLGLRWRGAADRGQGGARPAPALPAAVRDRLEALGYLPATPP